MTCADADGPHSYWTGFLTSRSSLKGYIRSSSNVFQAAKQMQAALAPAAELDPVANTLLELQRAMAVVQHHDAVAGTSMQHVANDYAKRVARGLAAAEPVLASAADFAFGTPGGSASCDLANATICPVFEALLASALTPGGAPSVTSVSLFVYNSKAQSLAAAPVRVPVALGAGVASYAVSGAGGAPVTAQLLPLSAADLALRNDYYAWPANANVTSVQWLVFLVDVPATGVAFYKLAVSASAEGAPHTFGSVVRDAGGADAPLSITNGDVTLTFDNVSQTLASFASTSLGVAPTPLSQAWFWYNSSAGNNVLDSQAGGAYIMRPNSSTPFAIDFSGTTLQILSGPVVSEARATLPWLAVTTRLFAGAATFDSEFTVGPVPIADGNGKEVVTRFAAPSLATAATWRSDSNCREMVTRVRDFRPSWNATIREPIAGNYAPVNCAIETTDAALGLTLFVASDRSQSGASIADGSVELLVQRRLLADDQRGVGEPLSEPGVTGTGIVVRGAHRVGLAPAAGGVAAALRRAAMQDASLFPPVARFALGAPARTANASVGILLAAPLPPNVHLLTFQSVAVKADGSLAQAIVRLAHLFEAGEHPTLSAPATVDLGAAFTTAVPGLRAPPLACGETTLPGALPLGAAPRSDFRFVAENGAERSLRLPADAGAAGADAASLVVTLGPMQVRTWVCQW